MTARKITPMRLDNPHPPHKIIGMEGRLEPVSAMRREDLALNILQLTLHCPHDQCNPSFCPLHDVRKLTPENRADWVRLLTDEDLKYIETYHEICLHWRALGDGQNPRESC